MTAMKKRSGESESQKWHQRRIRQWLYVAKSNVSRATVWRSHAAAAAEMWRSAEKAMQSQLNGNNGSYSA
jgi:hypothetical protein